MLAKDSNTNSFNFLKYKTPAEMNAILNNIYRINFNSGTCENMPLDDLLRGFYRNISETLNSSSYGFGQTEEGKTNEVFNYCIINKDLNYEIKRYNTYTLNTGLNRTPIDLAEWTLIIDVMLATVNAIEAEMNNKVTLNHAITSCKFGDDAKNYFMFIKNKMKKIIDDKYLSSIIGLQELDQEKHPFEIDAYQQTMICCLARDYSYWKKYYNYSYDEIDFSVMPMHYNKCKKHCTVKEMQMFESIYNIRLIYDIFLSLNKALQINPQFSVFKLIGLLGKFKYLPAPYFRSFFIQESIKAISFEHIKFSPHYSKTIEKYVNYSTIRVEAGSNLIESEAAWYTITEYLLKAYSRLVFPLMKMQLLCYLDAVFSDYNSMHSYLVNSELYKSITENNYYFRADSPDLSNSKKTQIIKYINSKFSNDLKESYEGKEWLVVKNRYYKNTDSCIKSIFDTVRSDYDRVDLIKAKLESDWILNPTPYEEKFVQEGIMLFAQTFSV